MEPLKHLTQDALHQITVLLTWSLHVEAFKATSVHARSVCTSDFMNEVVMLSEQLQMQGHENIAGDHFSALH